MRTMPLRTAEPAPPTAASPALTLTAAAAIHAHRVTVHYGAHTALHHVTFTARAGEIIGIVGPNGAGKTTLIKAVLGLVPLTAGSISVFGTTIGGCRGEVAYVPQRSHVDWTFPAAVRDIVAMGRIPRTGILRRMGPVGRELVNASIDRLGLSNVADRQIGELSGGQQQRVFLARALAQQPRVYLLDEPFAGVDVVTADLLWDEIGAAAAEGATVLVVHHDLHTAQRFDRCLVIAGRLLADGPPTDVLGDEVLRAAYRSTVECDPNGHRSAVTTRPSGGAWC